TYRMYVNLDEGARIDAVFGNAAGPLSIGAGDGMSFYQHTYGGNTSLQINPGLFVPFPALEWDSYVSIGCLYDDGTPFGNNALMEIGLDWTSFEGGGSIETNNGSWFCTPVDPQGEELNGMVFIGQFTVVGGTGDGLADLTGQISLQGKDADGNTWQELGVTWVPAPGALALLGFAGLAGRRRRR
ncbi:MAG: hypothetical protein QF781_09935, partial [Phycisphaerales bacterium]|nr:hypothetical protein [Phycisphaerales bacterium]